MLSLAATMLAQEVVRKTRCPGSILVIFKYIRLSTGWHLTFPPLAKPAASLASKSSPCIPRGFIGKRLPTHKRRVRAKPPMACYRKFRAPTKTLLPKANHCVGHPRLAFSTSSQLPFVSRRTSASFFWREIPNLNRTGNSRAPWFCRRLRMRSQSQMS
jgi:hypothetical protein